MGAAATTFVTSAVFAATPTLTVYTYDSFASEWGPGPQIKQAFEKECGCDLKYVALDDGVSILNRLKMEGSSTKADVVLGLDDSLMAEAKQTGLLDSSHVNLSQVNLPDGWSDSVFVPFDYGYFAFVYNKKKLQNPPSSLKELVEKRDDISIVYEDPRTSTPGQGLMFWVKNIYGDDASSAWKSLAKKTVTVTKGWSEAYSMFLKGEADMVLSYTTSPAYHLIAEKDDSYAAANFSEGHYIQVEVAAKVKGTQHAKLAKQFLQFMLSNQVQSIIPTTNWMYPVTKVDLPAGFETLTVPTKVLHSSSDSVAKNRKRWVREWQSALTF
ncbi:thiamine ABC transporter substrate binding subunit [Vibrio salinus]|uniref:thiamine ABC transporter substrate binding subunit n=1 Tax=Vibrio salinus TaxID=2899784 RepID=UPI001E3321DE|nr:thiamine ABC transporter substrate binding subunit [Vibrio salinus]MCE0494044.1 thiamine ABC transporter substrate binding subunit [Vibrio salinus]